jgi:hypothetical protein
MVTSLAAPQLKGYLVHSGRGELASLIVDIPLATSRGDLSSSRKLFIISERIEQKMRFT